MRDPISRKGYWWLPGLSQNKLFGTLTFSQESGGLLEVVGLFGKKSTPQGQQPIIIVGTAEDGMPITLHKCIIASWSDPLVGPGLGKASYHVEWIFDGRAI